MLVSPDGVDGSSVTHAYGVATDVPDLLRSLLSADKKERGVIVGGVDKALLGITEKPVTRERRYSAAES